MKKLADKIVNLLPRGFELRNLGFYGFCIGHKKYPIIQGFDSFPDKLNLRYVKKALKLRMPELLKLRNKLIRGNNGRRKKRTNKKS